MLLFHIIDDLRSYLVKYTVEILRLTFPYNSVCYWKVKILDDTGLQTVHTNLIAPILNAFLIFLLQNKNTCFLDIRTSSLQKTNPILFCRISQTYRFTRMKATDCTLFRLSIQNE